MKLTLPHEVIARWRRNLRPQVPPTGREHWRLGTREARVILQSNTPGRER